MHSAKQNQREMSRKKITSEAACFQLFSLTEKKEKKFTIFFVITKNISSNMLKISAISLVLCTHEIADIFIKFHETYFGIHFKK